MRAKTSLKVLRPIVGKRPKEPEICWAFLKSALFALEAQRFGASNKAEVQDTAMAFQGVIRRINNKKIEIINETTWQLKQLKNQ